ncbi:hypothetical protein [Chryseobacterium sp.]|uniref:hypothetical protein n=1 Tax=Chryseobacterium sp. TaxID=1871047 RepID=UPI0025C1B842|nr:hypothetical protein [Chryseobacterium sp.]
MNETVQSKLGDYLYLAMGDCAGQKVVMGIGYTYEYADKKAKQFEEASQGTVKYIDISMVKTGDKVKCDTLKRI